MDEEIRKRFVDVANILGALNNQAYRNGVITVIWLAVLTIWMVFK